MALKRLSKVLASMGIASRRHAEELIFQGNVSVNEQLVLVPQTLVDLEKDTIVCNGQLLPKKWVPKVYYLFNKPVGVLCSNVRKNREKIVLDFFPTNHRLFTVGRLDRDTSGLLLVTNDGEFAQQVIHPSKNLQKEYVVKTKQEITPEHLILLSKKVFFPPRSWIRALSVKKVRRGTFKIILKEGKKHEVRLLSEQAGLEVLDLKRVRIGPLLLGSIPIGSYRDLSDQEKEQLLNPSSEKNFF